MDTLGKFKTNFLKDRSSFKIGFNNRSPLSNLQGKLDGSLPTVSRTPPKLKSTIGSTAIYWHYLLAVWLILFCLLIVT